MENNHNKQKRLKKTDLGAKLCSEGKGQDELNCVRLRPKELVVN